MGARTKTSKGNVFHDVGFSAAESENLRIRADLMIQIRRLIERQKLTQTEAAKALGVTQPRISDLVRGKIDLFSIDTLVNMLAQAGGRVALTVAQPRARQKRTRAA